MRIIKEGSLLEFVHTCEKCGCVFAWDERDIVAEANDRIAVTCPCCHTRRDTTEDKPAKRGVYFMEV